MKARGVTQIIEHFLQRRVAEIQTQLVGIGASGGRHEIIRRHGFDRSGGGRLVFRSRRRRGLRDCGFVRRDRLTVGGLGGSIVGGHHNHLRLRGSSPARLRRGGRGVVGVLLLWPQRISCAWWNLKVPPRTGLRGWFVKSVFSFILLLSKLH